MVVPGSKSPNGRVSKLRGIFKALSAPCHNLVPWQGLCELELSPQSWVQSRVQSLEELEFELEVEEVMEKKPQVVVVPVPRRCSDQQKWKEMAA